ncbi:hypothetical protein NOM01_13170 [Sporolactobacillus sp. STSJ-5]|uniref:hypothetical protein n=1 Tax=Sporolactobacillus sp. STSJ-5 TaxID=2965076 RepID=UPI002104E682|nr:hypothetical protein [Sporolactobacillus sp. STSJ-5]MCQ2010960.1 hypothetical protein [Sporolactobacillus sp. STSJ-5]
MADTKRNLDRTRAKVSLKNMYYNRYLLVRYLTAGFFFVNLYWFLFLLLAHSKFTFIPLSLLVFLVVVAAEQVKLYSTHTNNTPMTRLYYWLQLLINLVLFPLVLSSQSSELFPFMANTQKAGQLLSAILFIGSLLCLVISRRLRLIRCDQDRHFERIKQYEKTLHI